VNTRFIVGLVLIAVGALAALGGAFALVAPNAAIGFRLGCGGLGLGCGGPLVVLGLRLRNRAVAESPELKRALEDNSGATSRTAVAKPSFLQKPLPAVPQTAPPPPPARAFVLYWVVFVAFAVAVMGLAAAVADFFQGAPGARAIALTVGGLVVLLFPLTWNRRRSGAIPPDDESSGDADDGGSD
jgi:hypothetical protein